MSISSVSAVFTEDFDDDTAGTNPTAPWYTYYENAGATGVVSQTAYVSSPNSFKFSSAFGWTRYNLKHPCQPSFVNLTVNVTSYDVMAIHDFILSGTANFFAEGWIVDDASFSLCYLDGATFYPIVDIIPNSWFNISFEINWTTEEFFLSGNNGSGWLGVWRPFASSVSTLTQIQFGNVGAIVLYVDDMFLDVDILPEAQIIVPVNGSNCNTNNTDFSVHEWDNDTVNPMNSTVYLYLWDGLSWNYISEHNNDSIASGGYHNGTFSDLCLNRTYGWFVNLTSDGDYTVSSFNVFNTGCSGMSVLITGYNSSSLAWDDVNETDGLDVILTLDAPNATHMAFSDASDAGPYSDDYDYDDTHNYTLPCLGNGYHTVYVRFEDACGYFYTNDTIYVNGTTPSVTINYPQEGDTYTSIQWDNNHILDLIGATDESFTIDINVTSEDFYTVLDYDVDYSSYASLTIDLEPYVWFDDQNYTITVFVENCFGNQTSTVNFTIGDPLTDLAKHISLKDLSPERENFSQLDLLEQGVTFDIICTEPNGIYYTFYLTDWDGNVLNEQDDVTILDALNGWQSKEYYSGRFYSRSFYKSWLGLYNGTSDVQFDDLYGYASIQYVSFMDIPLYHYVFNNTNPSNDTSQGRYQILVGNFLGTNVTIYDSYMGLMWGFGTYAIGDVIPFHSIGSSLYDRKDIYDNDWIQKYEDSVPGISIFMGFMVILFFSLLPTLITKTFPPLMIQLFFSEIGMVVAYAMGVFPLWIFEFILIALLLAIFYKVFSWYRERSGVQSFADTPIGKESVQKSKWVAKKGMGLAEGVRTRVKKFRVERQLRFPKEGKK